MSFIAELLNLTVVEIGGTARLHDQPVAVPFGRPIRFAGHPAGGLSRSARSLHIATQQAHRYAKKVMGYTFPTIYDVNIFQIVFTFGRFCVALGNYRGYIAGNYR